MAAALAAELRGAPAAEMRATPAAELRAELAAELRARPALADRLLDRLPQLLALRRDRPALRELLRHLGLEKLGERLRLEALLLRGGGEAAEAELSADSPALVHKDCYPSEFEGSGNSLPFEHSIQPLGVRRIAFWARQLCERGTDVAMFDYADFSELLLGLEAWVLYDTRSPDNFDACITKYRERFGDRLIGVASWFEGEKVLEDKGISYCYLIKICNDAFLPRSAKTLVHAVFDGTRCALILSALMQIAYIFDQLNNILSFLGQATRGCIRTDRVQRSWRRSCRATHRPPSLSRPRHAT